MLGPAVSPVSIRKRAATAALSWLLRDEYSSAAAAPLASPRTADPGPGTFTLVQNDGQFSVSGGSLQIPEQGTATWGDLGFYTTTALSRATGRALHVRAAFTSAATGDRFMFGWSNAQDASYANFRTPAVYPREGRIELYNVGYGSVDAGDYATATAYDFALVLRSTGAFCLVRGGAFAAWTLLWVARFDSVANLYPSLAAYSLAATVDRFRAADLGTPWDGDYGIALGRDTFTDAGGTSLDAHTPDVDPGGGWTESYGDWEIYENQARNVGSNPGDAGWLATLESGAADVLVESDITINHTGSANGAGIVLRYTDVDNLWLVQLNWTTSELRIYERNAGAWTQRASAAVTISAGTPYRVTAAAHGSTITAWLEGAHKISYSAATLNQSATRHGIRCAGAANNRHDNWTCYPRTFTAGAAYDQLEALRA